MKQFILFISNHQMIEKARNLDLYIKFLKLKKKLY